MSIPFSLLNASNNILLYRYEPFSYTGTKTNASYTTQIAGFTSPLASFLSTDGSSVVFAGPSGYSGVPTTSGNPESFTVRQVDLSGAVQTTTSNFVTIAPGRFRDDAGNSRDNTAIVLYRNEPFTPLRFNAVIPVSTPLSTPSLPVGLFFNPVSVSQYDLTGVPTFQSSSNNYRFTGIGSADPGKIIVTSNFNIAVNPERMRIFPELGYTIPNLTIGTPITPVSVTAACPPYPLAGGRIRYFWPSLPGNLTFADNLANPVSSGYLATDASSTIQLQGTPTSAGARSLISTNGVYTFSVVARRDASPQIQASNTFTLSFAPTLLFDTESPGFSFFKDVSVNPASNFLRAAPYFGAGAVTDIISTDLRSDLSVSYVQDGTAGIAQITGTPGLPTGTNNYTFRATNGVLTRDVTASISVTQDVVTAPTGVDACYNFIYSRPLTSFKAGYYTSNIQVSASSLSGGNIVFTAPQLVGTGLFFSNLTPTSARLVGFTDASAGAFNIPTAPLALTDVSLVATSSVTGVSNATNFKVAISPDIFTFNTLAASNFVYVPTYGITPYQVRASTLSENPVISYTLTAGTVANPLGFPQMITLYSSGYVSGTTTLQGLDDAPPNVSFTANTAFSSAVSQQYSNVIVRPNYYLYADPASRSLTIGNNVSVPLLLVKPEWLPDPVNYRWKDDLFYYDVSAAFGLQVSSNGVTGLLNPMMPTGTYPFYIETDFSLSYGRGGAPGQIVYDSSLSSLTFQLFNGPPSTTSTWFTSPTQRTFLFTQYVPITPIDVRGSNYLDPLNPDFYYPIVSTLPPGLVYNPVTSQITGSPTQLGSYAFEIGVYNSNASPTFQLLTLQFIIQSFLKGRQQESAAAYTSYVRQVATAAGVQNSRNGHVQPAQERAIPPFALQEPPDIVTQVIDPNCFKGNGQC